LKTSQRLLVDYGEIDAARELLALLVRERIGYD
jgi:hypothetical protein